MPYIKHFLLYQGQLADWNVAWHATTTGTTFCSCLLVPTFPCLKAPTQSKWHMLYKSRYLPVFVHVHSDTEAW